MKKFIMKKFFIVVSILLSPVINSVSTQTKQPVGIVEKLGTTIPLDEEFYDENGNLVTLKNVISRPTILTFVYYRCPGICSPLLTELKDVINKMDLSLGKDYQVVTISFDPDEKPELAKEKRENYVKQLNGNIDASGWRFFSGDSINIHRLTDAAGFYFERTGRDWIHAGGLIIVSPQGKITRYLYGIEHLPFDVKMALVEAAEGKPMPTIAKVLKFCYSYDPDGRKYTFNFLRISAVAIILLVATFVIVFIVRPRKKIVEKKDDA